MVRLSIPVQCIFLLQYQKKKYVLYRFAVVGRKLPSPASDFTLPPIIHTVGPFNHQYSIALIKTKVALPGLSLIGEYCPYPILLRFGRELLFGRWRRRLLLSGYDGDQIASRSDVWWGSIVVLLLLLLPPGRCSQRRLCWYGPGGSEHARLQARKGSSNC